MRSIIQPQKLINFLKRFMRKREIQKTLQDSKRPEGLRLFDFCCRCYKYWTGVNDAFYTKDPIESPPPKKKKKNIISETKTNIDQNNTTSLPKVVSGTGMGVVLIVLVVLVTVVLLVGGTVKVIPDMVGGVAPAKGQHAVWIESEGNRILKFPNIIIH